jgi:endonuclease/exonuclease/phosphatase family metal-dependent hydrolase
MRAACRNRVAVSCAIAVLAACGSSTKHEAVTVETRNIYLGGPVELVLGAPLAQVPAAVQAVATTVQATDFPTRAKALAAEIKAHQPDLVGLQEVGLWRSQTPGDGPPTPYGNGTAATHVDYDFLEILQTELSNLGLAYDPVATATNLDIELTGASGTDYRYTDRDVILARHGVSTSNPKSGAFTAKLPVTLGGTGSGGPSLQVPRGWTMVDVQVGGKSFRFVNAHLEAFDPATNAAQGMELIQLAGRDLPVVMVGDFNSGPGVPTYYSRNLAFTAGYEDAWNAVSSTEVFTCCHDPGLMQPSVAFDSRVDMVLVRGVSAKSAVIVGTSEMGTSPPLWSSDHAGVVAGLEL